MVYLNVPWSAMVYLNVPWPAIVYLNVHPWQAMIHEICTMKLYPLILGSLMVHNHFNVHKFSHYIPRLLLYESYIRG